MKSSIVKRSVVVGGHKTSVSLEEPFYQALKDLAASRRVTLSDLVAGIDTAREKGNLSSAIRLFVLNHYQARPSYEGQTRPSPAREMMMMPPQTTSVLRAE